MRISAAVFIMANSLNKQNRKGKKKMQETTQAEYKISGKLTLKNPWCSKALLIISLLVILQIPLYLVSDLTKERNERYIKVRNEIAQTWGQEQTVKMLLHAEKEKYTINITPEIRYRGIYQVPVYNADINIRAEYQNLSADSENGVYISDINAVTNCQITVNGKPVETKIKENCYKLCNN